MTKSTKIWKIEYYDYSIRIGLGLGIHSSMMTYPINTDYIFETELDCVLDIVTEPSNHGLKVYKHQLRVVEYKDLDSAIECSPIYYPLIEDFDLLIYEEPKYQTREYIEKLEKNTYRFLLDKEEYAKFYKYRKEYWVDCFMQ